MGVEVINGIKTKIEISGAVEKTGFTFHRHWRVLIASLSAALTSLGLGTVVGYTSPAIPDLNSNPNKFYLNDMEVAIVVSSISIGGVLGGPIAGVALDKMGRKLTIMYLSLPFVVGWLLIAVAPNMYCMMVGRILTGFCCGAADVAVPLYIAEISAPNVRGLMGSCHELCTNIGCLFVFAFGCFLHWNWLAIVCQTIPVIMVICMAFMPESPRWLLSKNQKEQGVEVLMWLRVNETSSNIDLEISEIETNINNSAGKFDRSQLLTLKRPLAVIIGLMFFQQFAGYGCIPQYMVTIIDSGGSTWNPYGQAAIVGAVGVVSNCVSAVVVDRAGRRVMLTTSALFMSLALSALAAFFTVKAFMDATYVVWMPTVCLIVYNISVALGYGPVPFYMASELFPLRARGISGGIGILLLWIFTFATALVFPLLINDMKGFGIYWIFAGVALIGMAFVILFVPETKGKSLEQVEQEYGNGPK